MKEKKDGGAVNKNKAGNVGSGNRGGRFFIAFSVIAASALLIAAAVSAKKNTRGTGYTAGDASSSPSVNSEIRVPEDETSFRRFDPGDPFGNGDVAPGETAGEGDPSAAAAEDRTVIPETEPAVSSYSSVSGTKSPDETKRPADDGEILNDVEESGRKEAESGTASPAYAVHTEQTRGTGGPDKPVSVTGEDESEEVTASGPAFVNPSHGGPNPFAAGTSSPDERDASEYTAGGEGPGGGILF